MRREQPGGRPSHVAGGALSTAAGALGQASGDRDGAAAAAALARLLAERYLAGQPYTMLRGGTLAVVTPLRTGAYPHSHHHRGRRVVAAAAAARPPGAGFAHRLLIPQDAAAAAAAGDERAEPPHPYAVADAVYRALRAR
jgi:hypothetical protein